MPLAKGINLLSTRKEVSAEKARKVRLAKTASLVLLVFYSLVVVGIFSFWVYLRKEGQRVEEEISLSKRRIRQLEKIESLQLVLKGRLASLRKILEKEELDYRIFLSYFNQFTSEGVVLNNVTASSDGQISFSGEAENAVVLASLLEKVAQEEALFSKVVLTSIVRGKEGHYLVDLNLEANQ